MILGRGLPTRPREVIVMRKKLFLFMFLLLIPTVAFARIGTGIGISFPIGGEGETHEERSEEVPTYGAFTDGVLMQELTVEEKNGKYVVTFEVTNLTDSPYIVKHKTGQCYEMAILNEHGKVMERWSSDISYTQAVQEETYPAKETVTHRGSFDVKITKTISGTPSYISAQIADTNNIVIAKLPTKISVKTSKREGIRGSIVITSGSGGRW